MSEINDTTSAVANDTASADTGSILSQGALDTPVVPEAQVTDTTTTTAPEVKGNTWDINEFLGTLNEDLRGNETLKKYKSLEELAKGTVELSKLVGYKGDIPAHDAPEEEVNAFWNKLGKPKDVSEYGIEVPEALTATEHGKEQVEKAMQLAYDSNLTKEQADKLMTGLFDLELGGLEQATQAVEAEKAEHYDRLQKEWGNGATEMFREVHALQQKFGVTDTFNENGLNNNADFLLFMGKLAKDLGESSTIETAVASTPTGIENELNELNAKVEKYLRTGERVPPELQQKVNDTIARMG